MRFDEREIEKIRPGNLRVPRSEFAALWDTAEVQASELAASGYTDWVSGGVAMTCRWLAGAVVVSHDGQRQMPIAPITRHERPAFEEVIEAEYLAAVAMEVRPPRERLYGDRTGYVEAVLATLRWAWRRSGPVPDLRPVN
ncbi:hypothetical protein [Pseudonocardia sp. N23]|uniref:hypothetical protein n=1 Tax=Pseudonocardia sp. N23 TaxID=1987376 RepID=UPI000BFD0432|nr:hypothetical protein [Pseudonocardia sp. N23]GAY09627.1 hypothetical protein TOK_3894 [Pseudonocardia sp. N23]